MNTTTLDLDKPVQTRGGLPVRIICRDKRDEHYPLVALVTKGGGVESIETYRANGSFCTSAHHPWDLVNVPEEKVTFFNLYGPSKTLVSTEHGSLEEANACAIPGRQGCIRITRLDDVIKSVELV